ncbi:unnamed protein product [Acanthosepion pharaonis]|uniref:Uncharacterized protein n=1 Tax=Acanthosepion pharaonis TaxID=158019 RepID=A0A812D573_ACAPH|nr:unnamed protein product [Sepia pharaonis]
MFLFYWFHIVSYVNNGDSSVFLSRSLYFTLSNFSIYSHHLSVLSFVFTSLLSFSLSLPVRCPFFCFYQPIVFCLYQPIDFSIVFTNPLSFLSHCLFVCLCQALFLQVLFHSFLITDKFLLPLSAYLPFSSFYQPTSLSFPTSLSLAFTSLPVLPLAAHVTLLLFLPDYLPFFYLYQSIFFFIFFTSLSPIIFTTLSFFLLSLPAYFCLSLPVHRFIFVLTNLMAFLLSLPIYCPVFCLY